MNVTEILEQYAAGIRDFSGVNLTQINLSGANLSGANLSGANLSVANLSGANLSGTNLSRANLNVARLSSANLAKANLTQANLNVANLMQADLTQANLTQATLIRAELIRTQLQETNLLEANLSEADLREANLRQAKLSRAILSEANLRGAFLTAVDLEGANLNKADLRRIDLSGSNLKFTDIRQANLSCANLSGADLSGANLRWCDLSGANLRWTDFSNAKLSGTNLIGADLSNANLLNTSLVHADLTQTRLIKAHWIGADLSGATLTGAKLYAVSRFGLKTAGLTCDWLDLSPKGDGSEIFSFSREGLQKFFNECLPTVRIFIDAPLDLNANLALAYTYHQIAQIYPIFNQAPSIEVDVRRTALTFRIESNAELFTIAYLAILPFSDGEPTGHNILTIINLIKAQELDDLAIKEPKQIQQLITEISKVIEQIDSLENYQIVAKNIKKNSFFQAPTHTVVMNSFNQKLNIYNHPYFGKYLLTSSSLSKNLQQVVRPTPELTMPSVAAINEFIKSFDYLEQFKAN
jgi:uncharacterized protein YjbI with pentapeptide repeats